jgi:hypothetical protein
MQWQWHGNGNDNGMATAMTDHMSMESLELNFSKIGYDGAIRFSESIHQQ